jgi:ribosomal protein S18 acetylase RimI-like enzyme
MIFHVVMEFGIRNAEFEDAPAIARVNYLTWLDAYRGLIPDLELDSMNVESLTDKWKQNFSIANPKIGTFVATSSESVVAYSRFYPSVDPDDDRNRVATIGSLYVDTEFQRKGIGRNLMRAVLEAAKNQGFTEATLHVLAANIRAREFYEGLDWQKDLNADIEGSKDETAPRVRYRKDLL